MAYASVTIEGVTDAESSRKHLSPRVSQGGSRGIRIERVSIKQFAPEIDKEDPLTAVGYRVRLFDHPSKRTALLELEVPDGGQETTPNRPDALLPGQVIPAHTYTGHLYATAECTKGELGEEYHKTIVVEVMTSPA